jgi:SnoaL-like domain
MAKQARKRPAKSTKKPTRSSRPARKAISRNGRVPAPSPKQNPSTVNTGSGPGPAEIGKSLVELYNAGKWDEPCKKWWSPEIVSVEGMGMAWSGRSAVNEKNAGWYREHRVLGGSAEGPFVGASGFAVRFRMEYEHMPSGKRIRMDEVGVYTVQNGKIVREGFM